MESDGNPAHSGPVAACFQHSSATQRALATVEVLCSVLVWGGKATQAACAQVNRQWFHCSIRMLWEAIDFIDAVKLLAPIVKQSKGRSYELAQRPTPNDWKRFLVYAVHVKRLLGRRYTTTEEMMSILASSRPVLHIFPTLETIEWQAHDFRSLVNITVLFAPTITSLDFSLKIETWINHSSYLPKWTHAFNVFCQEIQSRLPYIKNLSIREHLPSSEFAQPLTKLIRNAGSLEICHLPKYGIDTEFILALSRLPKLSQIHWAPSKSLPKSTQISNLKVLDLGDLDEGAFQSLTMLHITNNLRNIHKLLDHSHGPRFLTTLNFSALHNETSDGIRDLVTTIAAMCSRLENLTLDLSVPMEQIDMETYMPCDWNLFRPILQCRSLVRLRITHALPLVVTEGDIEEIARDRTTWKSIKLGMFPAFDLWPRPTLTFLALLPFAQHCPNLESLGLFLDGLAELPEAPLDLPYFSSLRELDVGISVVSTRNIILVGSFLADTCTNSLTIRPNLDECTLPLNEAMSSKLEKYQSCWVEMEKLQNTICKSQRHAMLQVENSNLRAKVEGLEKRIEGVESRLREYSLVERMKKKRKSNYSGTVLPLYADSV